MCEEGECDYIKFNYINSPPPPPPITYIEVPCMRGEGKGLSEHGHSFWGGGNVTYVRVHMH